MTTMLQYWPPHTGRIEGIEWRSGCRYFWIGRTGLGFAGSDRGYNAHWSDVLRHPWRRWSTGEYRWVDFFAQIARGVREFVRG